MKKTGIQAVDLAIQNGVDLNGSQFLQKCLNFITE
tara:strand:+ start:158 stop:262 length:105 start_codon:yes stop_codon:yes gene_type:complete